MNPRFTVVLFALAATACASQAAPQFESTEADTKRLHAVVAADHACPSVVRTFRHGIKANGREYWAVECSSGAAYVVVAGGAGERARVLNCSMLTAAGSGCFERLR